VKVKTEPEMDTKPEKQTLIDLLDSDDEDELAILEHYTFSSKEMAEREIKMYRCMPKFDKEGNPLAFWHDNSSMMPALASLAKKYLVVQATSVPAECVFSTAGDIVRSERARLRADNVDALIFLKKNLEGPF
jgi:hypothetical protein